MLSVRQIEQKLEGFKKTYLAMQRKPFCKADMHEQVAARIIYVLSTATCFLPLLQDLNQRVQAKLPDVQPPVAPEKYVTLYGSKFPAPKSLDDRFDPYLVALDAVLLEQEQKHGVNLNRTTQDIPVFLGQIPDDMADKYIIAGERWNDSPYDMTGFYHGSYSHRIQHYVVTRTLEQHPEIFSDILPRDEGRKNIFRHLVNRTQDVKYVRINPERQSISTQSLWIMTLDVDPFRRPDMTISKFGLCGPVLLNSLLLNENSFVKMPALARAVFSSYLQPLRHYAEVLKLGPEALMAVYVDSINNRRFDSCPALGDAFVNYKRSFLRKPNCDVIAANSAVVMHAKPASLQKQAEPVPQAASRSVMSLMNTH